jgi:hypothetical protein
MSEREALIAVLIVERPLCVDCIADKSGIALVEIDSLLRRIGASIKLNRIVDRCRACGRTVEAYAMTRSE